VYAAITCASPSGVPLELTGAKLQLLNRALDDRLRTSGKKILADPDLFDLHRRIARGQPMLDSRLADLPAAGAPRPAEEKIE